MTVRRPFKRPMAGIFRRGADWKIEEPDVLARNERRREMYSLWRREAQSAGSYATRWYFIKYLTKAEAEKYGVAGSSRRAYA